MIDDDAWDGPATPDEAVRVGPWSFRLRGAEIADVVHRGVPVLRAVRFVTRDHDWRTAEDTVTARIVEVDQDAPSGRIRIATSTAFDGVEVLRSVIEVGVDGGTVLVHATATVVRPFLRNRVGLVVLHPPTLAGLPFTVQHPVGPPTEHVFPTWIAPHQPAEDVVGYAWAVDGIDAELRLAGDVYEMEDQRNWTDASYKTYSTPLAEPFPVALVTGDEVRQAVTLQCGPSGTSGPSTSSRSERPGGAPSSAAAVAALDGPAPQTVVTPGPSLQLLAGSAPAAARPADGALLTGLPVLVEPVLDSPDAAAVLAGARRDVRGGPLDVRFVTDDTDLLRAWVDRVLDDGPVARIGAFDPRTHGTTGPLQEALRRIAAEHDGLQVVAGTRAHFTELNRGIDDLADWDGPLTFSVTPQMHDRSRAQVTESLRMQRWVVMSASRLADGRPLHVGPVTLRPRFNAVATSPRRVAASVDVDGGHGPEHVPDATDPGQHSSAAGAWFAAAVAALSVPGVASITLAEAWGPRGVVASDGTHTPAAAAIGSVSA